MVNSGQQMRLATKLKRNLEQVFKTTDALTVTRSVNTTGDNIIEISDGTWHTGDTYILIKFQEITLGTYPVQGLPVHKIMICAEADAGGSGIKSSVGFFVEAVARCKDMGCAIEVYTTSATTQPADQDTSGGNFNSGLTPKRWVRASVDMLNIGQ